MIIDGMMHLEIVGEYWEGLIEEVLEHYDAAGIDKGVVLATWMDSRESNDRTRDACRRYPDRFIPSVNVDANHGMDAVRAITKAYETWGVRAVTMFPAAPSAWVPALAFTLEFTSSREISATP